MRSSQHSKYILTTPKVALGILCLLLLSQETWAQNSSTNRRAPNSLQQTYKLSGTTYLSHWNGFHNSAALFEAQLKNQQPKSQFQYSLEVNIRSDSSFPVLGNINQAEYFLNSNFSIGRQKPSSEFSVFSLDRNFNHRICQTPFNCNVGGVTGLHYNNQNLQMSFELLNVPNFSPTPKRLSHGQLESKYRWTQIPYQFVEINNSLIPLRISTSAQLAPQDFLTPGLQAHYKLNYKKQFHSQISVASQRSKSAKSTSKSGLQVVNENNQLVAVVNNSQNISFPWMTLIASKNNLSIDKHNSLFLDTTHEIINKSDYDFHFGWRHKHNRLNIKIHLGHHKRDSYLFQSLGGELTSSLGQNLSASINTLYIFKSDEYSILLSPSMTYAINPKLKIFTQAFLINSTQNETIFSQNRSQDNINLGVSYEI